MGIFEGLRALFKAAGKRITSYVKKQILGTKEYEEEQRQQYEKTEKTYTEDFRNRVDEVASKYDTDYSAFSGDAHTILTIWDEMPQRIRNLYYMIAEQLGESPDIKFTKKAHEIMINSDLLNYFLDAYEADIPEAMQNAIKEIKDSMDYGLLDSLDESLADYQQLRDNIKKVL